MEKTNVLIVESENDQYFIQALANNISSKNKVCRLDEFEYSSPNEKSLIIGIQNALTDVRGRGISKIGIILDMDNSNEEKRIALVNRCLKGALLEFDYSVPDKLIENISSFVKIPIDEYLTVQVACFFTNIDGQGELETLLKAIKTQPSIFADCLYEGWKDCLLKKGKKIVGRGEQGCISEKELLKLWVDFYKRFDTLRKGQRDKENTDWRGIMIGEVIDKNENLKKLKKIRGEEIFDLDSDKLTDIKSFLELFK